jgi:hypothetical protein
MCHPKEFIRGPQPEPHVMRLWLRPPDYLTCTVQGLSCPGFVVSRVCRVQGLSCPGFVCPGFVRVPTELFIVEYLGSQSDSELSVSHIRIHNLLKVGFRFRLPRM